MKLSHPSRYTRSVGLLFLVPAFAFAREDWAICGTGPLRDAEERALHQSWNRSAAFSRARAATIGGPRQPAARDIGNIAVLDDDSIVARRNTFDLASAKLRFLPTGSGYRYDRPAGGYDGSLAPVGSALALGDDDSRQVTIPFAFPFYGRTYTSVYVNSDGTLTFGEPDTSTEARSVGRVTSGPPRIAVLFHDLDPTRPGAGVRLLTEAGRMVVSWVAVPRFGIGLPQTFQALLYSDGRVEFAYETVATLDAIVGLAPGRLQGTPQLVDFTDPSSAVHTSAVLERFSGAPSIDMTFTAQRFYETHDDAYDFLAVFNDLNIDADVGAVAFALTYRDLVTGIGGEPLDLAAEAGSPRRLQTLMNMGQLSQYPTDPNGPVVKRGGTGDTPITILGHETGHRFLAYASVDGPNGATPMLSNDGAHWAFTFNSEASLLEGNRIRDNGEGVSPRFVTTGTVEAYAPLDLYLMGFQPPQEVPPSFYVTGATVSSNALPLRGVGFNGTRRDVTVEEVIAAEGRRTPDHTVAQRRFRMAFILVTAAGRQPSAADLAKIETFRNEFESFFSRATGGRATMDTTLRRNLDLSLWPAAGIVEGAARQAKLEISRAAEAALTVSIQTNGSVLGAPQSVTIQPGTRSAQFEVRGLRAGTSDLRAEPSDPAFGGITASLQVLPATQLAIRTVSGGGQTAVAGEPLGEAVRFQVLDANRLPYEGVPVQASVTSGSVTPQTALSDASGFVDFQWTPGINTSYRLTAALANGATAEATALTRPVTAANAVANSASYALGLVPGSIGVIFGSNLAGGQAGQAAPPLPLEIAGVRVTVAGRAAQLFYVSDGQINILVPGDVPIGSGDVVITSAAGSSQPVTVPILRVQPGIYQQAGVGAVLIYPTHLEIYCTGLGPVARAASGFDETVERPQVALNGQPLDVLYSGPAPTFPGLYQVNVRRPAGVTGTRDLRITMGGIASNTVAVTLP